jgi:RecB family exonuclease
LSPADVKQCQRFVNNFMASRLGQKKPAPEDVEVPFTLVLQDGDLTVALNGAIDRMDRLEDGTCTITDYKTNRGVEPERYRLQLSIYRLAAERVLARKVRAAQAYFVGHPETVGLADVRLMSVEETERKIVDTARRIAARSFDVADTIDVVTCWRCPFGGYAGPCPSKRVKPSVVHD